MFLLGKYQYVIIINESGRDIMFSQDGRFVSTVLGFVLSYASFSPDLLFYHNISPRVHVTNSFPYDTVT